ncbi:hypothetical protein [Falsiroseomonas selenitidurans]|uniref:Uncharacterized protein n=1 Tax=Falsiroseomonas selenitidurans TaxID=2716335 RepID=A0ABX1E1B8_9PROT|nr:hypothetical protein [Falsiroseomonas selenitidurans]NKC30954.1 hypothetical protein [Falsiroseomonas selenitidurans]
MLQDLVAALTVPGLPDWAGVAVLVLLALVALAYLLMPFSVFGLKGRLEAIEAQLDELQAELRSLAVRLPEPTRRRAPLEEEWEHPPVGPRPQPEASAPRTRPPVPPPATWPERQGSSGRSEPKLDWPKR